MPADAISKVNGAVKLDKEIMRALIVEPQPVKEGTDELKTSYISRRPRTAAETKPEKKEGQSEDALSNELLEEKLEEILQ